MHSDLEYARALLVEEDLSLVCVRDGAVVYRYKGHGVRGLLEFLSMDNSALGGSYAADRLVGKAAALLFAAGGVSGVYTPVVSSSGLQVFSNHHLLLHYDRVVDYIRNRTGSGMCPLEELCFSVDDPAEALSLILEFVKERKT